MGYSVTWQFLPLSTILLGTGLGGIPSFESMEHESKVAA
jgi:hypothetical protein